MAGRSKRSVRDEWLDTFADRKVEEQENWLEMAEFVHRQTKRTAAKNGKPAEPEQIPLGERDSG